MGYKAIDTCGNNPNYYASIQKIDKVESIEGSDYLVKTTVCGRTVVASKKLYKEGSIVVYFPHGCVICEEFLSANNLYDLHNYKKNRNSRDVDAVLYEMNNEKNIAKKQDIYVKARSMCGYFDASGRVKTRKIRGVHSEGFIIHTYAITAMDSIFSVVDWENHIGMKFDTLNATQVCWKYINKHEAHLLSLKPKQTFYQKAMKKVKRNANLVENQFRLHYDTSHLSEFMNKINPYDDVAITVKIDGSACCVSNILVNKKLNFFERFARKIGFNVKENDYHVVYSSHHIIKSLEINPGANLGFYGVDIWEPVKNLIGKYLSKGMSIYGEVVGYIEGTDLMIQPDRDYGCKVGEWKFMPYRITETDKDGVVTEWSMDKVCASVEEMMCLYPELKAKLLPPKMLYFGKFCDLYKDIPVDGEWANNVYERMKNDTTLLGMELDEPLCKISGPREGVVVRVGKEAYKLKSQRHLALESERADKGDVDIESLN